MDSSLQFSERNATLIVIKNVTFQQSNSSTPVSAADRSEIIANDFIMHVNGNNPSPFDFAGSESGTNVSISQGPYAVTETKPFIPSPFQGLTRELPAMILANYSKDYTRIIKDAEIKTRKVIDTLY
jgi:hypothetical protein